MITLIMRYMKKVSVTHFDDIDSRGDLAESIVTVAPGFVSYLTLIGVSPRD